MSAAEQTAGSEPNGAPDPLLRVRDASEHNLRHVDVEIPRDRIVAFTGVSGSGKSSLAFATIYAEAQQRYLESVAPYAARLIQQGTSPRVGEISGLPPAVALRQQHGGASSRSTVGTVSRVSNVLRMLYSRAGTYPAGRAPHDLRGSFPRDAAPLDSDAFSPNTAVGACPTCHGLGRLHSVDVERLVGDTELSIQEGAIAAWPGAWQGKNYRNILATLGIDVDVPFRLLPIDQREWLLTTEEQPVVTVDPVRDPSRVARTYQGTYISPRSWVLHTFASTKSASLRAKAASFMTDEVCPTCGGRRLNPEALAVTVGGVDIAEAAALPMSELAAFLDAARTHPDTLALPAERRQAAEALIAGLGAHLRTLIDLGLGYLATGRTTATLSGGEFQRLHLATQLRSGLFGVLYVLDEPSAGLHPADTALLVSALRRLRTAGNSVFVVEHNTQVIAAGDWIVDLGPGAGRHGGRVLYSGAAAGPGLSQVPDSVTARYLDPAASEVPRPPEPREPKDRLRLTGVTGHNLRDLDVSFPLGTLTAVTGVSGSGKSTLVQRALAETVRRHLRPQDPQDARDPRADSPPRRIPWTRTRNCPTAPSTRTVSRWPRRRGWTAWTVSCASIRSRSAARPAPTWPPTRGCSTASGSCTPRSRLPASAVTRRAGSPSTCRRAAARTARATASSASRCCSCRRRPHPARCATEPATTRTPSRSPSGARASPTCSR